MRFRFVGALAAVAALSAAAGPAMAGKADDTLNWATPREVAVIDPYYNNTRELVIMGQLIWDGLTKRNLETGEYEPLLATSWEWVDDVTLDLQLRQGVKFHDGSDFDAEDVAYTMNFTSKEENGVLTYRNVSWIKEAEVTGSHSVRIHLKAPFPPALAYLDTGVLIMPSGHYDSAPKKADGNPDYGQVPVVGTGPYKFVESKPGEYVLLSKNENYMDGSPKGKPQVGNIRFRTIQEMNTQVAELMTGGLDWIWDVPKDQAERLDAAPNVTVANAKTFRISYLEFDVPGESNTDVFKNPKVRQAVAHAINRQSISENLVGPASEVIHTLCHPDQFGCTQDVTQYDYNPEKAKALLAEAGYPDGFEFDIYGYRQREFTEAVIGDLAAVGIKANLNWLQYRALRDIIRKGETPIGHMTWGSYSIPDVSAIVSHFFKLGPDDPAKDPALKELLDVADSTIDPEVRKAKYQEAFETIASNVYMLPMFTYAKYYAWSEDLDFQPTPDEIPRFYTAAWK